VCRGERGRLGERDGGAMEELIVMRGLEEGGEGDGGLLLCERGLH